MKKKCVYKNAWQKVQNIAMTAANSTIFQHAIGSTRLCSMQNIVIMVIIVMQASSHIASQLQLARCAIAIVPFENWDEETKKNTHRFQLSSWTIVELSFNYSHTWLSKWPPFYLEPCTQQSTFLSLNTLYNAIFIHDENHKELPIYSTADTAAKWKISRDFQIMWN